MSLLGDGLCNGTARPDVRSCLASPVITPCGRAWPPATPTQGGANFSFASVIRLRVFQCIALIVQNLGLAMWA